MRKLQTVIAPVVKQCQDVKQCTFHRFGPAHCMQEDYVPEGEVVLTVENKSPLHDTFQFQRINGGLTRSATRACTVCTVVTSVDCLQHWPVLVKRP